MMNENVSGILNLGYIFYRKSAFFAPKFIYFMVFLLDMINGMWYN